MICVGANLITRTYNMMYTIRPSSHNIIHFSDSFIWIWTVLLHQMHYIGLVNSLKIDQTQWIESVFRYQIVIIEWNYSFPINTNPNTIEFQKKKRISILRNSWSKCNRISKHINTFRNYCYFFCFFNFNFFCSAEYKNCENTF